MARRDTERIALATAQSTIRTLRKRITELEHERDTIAYPLRVEASEARAAHRQTSQLYTDALRLADNYRRALEAIVTLVEAALAAGKRGSAPDREAVQAPAGPT